VHPPRHRAPAEWNGHRPDAVASRPTRPDVRALWRAFTAVREVPPGTIEVAQWRWRVTESDWQTLLTDPAMRQAVAPAPPLLWGIGVETVPNGRGRLPELLLVISDRLTVD
jgi:hypothetical protein